MRVCTNTFGHDMHMSFRGAFIKLSVTMWFVYPCSLIELLWNKIQLKPNRQCSVITFQWWYWWWTLRTLLLIWSDQFHHQQQQRKTCICQTHRNPNTYSINFAYGKVQYFIKKFFQIGAAHFHWFLEFISGTSVRSIQIEHTHLHT